MIKINKLFLFPGLITAVTLLGLIVSCSPDKEPSKVVNLELSSKKDFEKINENEVVHLNEVNQKVNNNSFPLIKKYLMLKIRQIKI